MIARTKIFLLWLLALAIPVQGFAAVAQLGCATPQAMQVSASMPAMPMEHMMHMMSSTGDAMMQHAIQHQHAPADPIQHHTSSSSCSSCSVCTIGAILPLALDQLIPLPLPADLPVAMTAHGFVGYTPENPERPPSLQG